MKTNKLYFPWQIVLFCFLISNSLLAQTGVIRGNITNACGAPLVGVPVYFSGPNNEVSYTDENGNYFYESEIGGDYTVMPYLIDDIKNGVDEMDLDTLHEYFFDIENSPLNPYQLLAANVDWSGGISTYDLVLLSKVAMDIIADFAEPYWRFIDADFVFPNPTAPWGESIPEVFSVNNSIGDTITLDFVGIKLGDIDCSANTDFTYGVITGTVYGDFNEDCVLDGDEPGFENYILEFNNGMETYYATTDQNGQYVIHLEGGSYTVHLNLPNNLVTACQNDIQLDVVEFEQYEENFGVQFLVNEPYLEVDISTYFLRRCSDNFYTVNFCNNGNAPAADATVMVAFDPFITVTNASVPYTQDAGLDNTYVFEIGDIAHQDCGFFKINVHLSCDAELGQTHCVNAHIFPEPTLEAGANWDGSSLTLSSACEPDSVRFNIKNEGATMETPVQYIVIEDDLIMISGEVRLDAGAETDIALEANGTTKRLEMSQAPGYPGYPSLANAIEACGINEEGTFSTGFVTQFPDADGDPFISIDCQENIGPFDPNDKRAFPKGVGENHYLEANTDLEYLIRFQNVGTDTAFNVVIKDTLPNALDPATFIAGAASHPYRFEMAETGILSVYFENIQLPDSTTNEPASNGFFKFRIQQKTDNPIGTIIENNAAIFFDFNEPVITNYSWHMIAEDFLFADSVNIMGKVTTFVGNPIEGAEVILGPDQMIDYTSASGDYIFSQLPTMQDYQLEVHYDSHPTEGVTTFDAVLIAKHILGANVFNSPYQLLAADLNNSGSVTTLDIVMLRQIVLGFLDSLPVNWQFVPADLVFPDPADPWSALSEDDFLIDNLLYHLNFDIIGIKKGDVNGSFESNLYNLPDQSFQVDAIKTAAPNLYQLDFYASEKAFQGLHLVWDIPADIRFQAYLPGCLPELDHPHFNVVDQQFRLSWSVPDAFTLEKEAILFSWLVEAKDFGSLQQSIRSMNESHASFLILSDLKIEPVGLMMYGEKGKSFFVHPNPSPDTWNIQVKKTQASATSLKLYTIQGQLIRVILDDAYLEAGHWHFELESDALQPGTYWLELQSEDGRELQKVVKL